MAFDGITVSALVSEFNSRLAEGRIYKIAQTESDELMITYKAGKTQHKMLISANASLPLAYFTENNKQAPLTAPNFCMLLRKHLIGGKISNISMQGLERIVNIEIETINEFNEIENKTLILELMGKHSNIILKNQNDIIIDAMRHIASNNSYREILPSRIYTLPQSNKYEFTKLSGPEEFGEKLEIDSTENDYAKKLSNTFTGISLSFAKSAVEQREVPEIYNYINEIINSEKLKFELEGSDYVLKLSDQEKEMFELNFFIDDFYFERETTEAFTNARNTMLRMILEVLKKYKNRLASIDAKLQECDGMDKYRLYGELITANLYQLTNTHSDSIELYNYYDNSNIKIPLDVKYSPSMNAKRYFKKYSKLKNAYKIVSEQKVETEKELNYIESIVYELEDSTCLEDVQDIFEEISENVVFKEKLKRKEKKNKNQKKKKQQKFSPIEYEVNEYKIYVGRNNKENDWLTLSFASKTDYWFHTKDVQGSHVILKADKEVNDDILVKVAEIAAKHSKAKMSSNVQVDYCLVQFVKKPNGSKPGMVIFTNNKTLNVNPQK